MKLPRGAFIFPCGQRAVYAWQSAGGVMLDLYRLLKGDEWEMVEAMGIGHTAALTPQGARKLVRHVIAATERAAAWKRAARIVRKGR